MADLYGLGHRNVSTLVLVHAVAEACHTVPRPLPASAMKEKTDVQIASRPISHEFVGFFSRKAQKRGVKLEKHR